MKKMIILHSYFFKDESDNQIIGGVETYIKNLTSVAYKMNYEPIIFQFSNKPFIRKYGSVEVIGVVTEKNWSVKKKSKEIFQESKKYSTSPDDIYIFSLHSLSTKNTGVKSIVIQHGITFDIIDYEEKNQFKILISSFIRFLKGINTIRHLDKFNNIVAVDYNFINWYRTIPFYKHKNIKVIPNFVNSSNEEPIKEKDPNIVSIIFARRFQYYRGTRLFSNVIDKIIHNYKHVEVTFAGEGPDERYLKERFKENKNIKFIQYDSNDSILIHSKNDIAVVPTIGSEGTSLSLLEAMASKCAVIATNVGGMTNIILDSFNGLLINPSEKELYESLALLIENKSYREYLANNAYETSKKAFCKEIWEKKWISFIKEI